MSRSPAQRASVSQVAVAGHMAWPGLQSYANVEWRQFMPFVEIGRVAPKWNLGTLHSSMQ
jgi:hypothetical protein